MINGECDPVIDECMLLIQKLKEAKVDVSQRIFSGQIHGFATLPMQFPTPFADAMNEIVSTVKDLNAMKA